MFLPKSCVAAARVFAKVLSDKNAVQTKMNGVNEQHHREFDEQPDEDSGAVGQKRLGKGGFGDVWSPGRLRSLEVDTP